ncbi:MAG: DUF2877 domain-containing protein [Opitutae bacterium]|nr:DUF2877 domain-containing protein [Opitutae bacterium]
MKVLSMGDRIRPGAYALRARFARSVLLLDHADRALFVVDRAIGPGPLNLVVADPNAFVSGDSLAIPRRADAPRFDSRLPRLDRAARARLLRTLASALPRHAPPASLVSLFAPAKALPRLQASRDALFQKAFGLFAAGRLAAGVKLIRGCGEGLTPSGDDFLCGWMLALRLRRIPAPLPTILKSARGGNRVSNAFLEMAAQGRVNVAVKNLLQAPSAARVHAVCGFGHSSGADLLCGLRYGL